MELTYHEARNRALSQLLQEDERVLVLGSSFSGPFETPNDFPKRFPSRFYGGSISEMGFAAAAVGAALSGLRPIVDFSTSSFIYNAWETVVNEAPNLRYMSGGKVSVPVVFHILSGARGAGAAQHSHSPEAMLWNTPGLKIFIPSCPADAAGLFKTAVADPNPCIFVDHIKLFEVTGEVDPALPAVPFGKARTVRPGKDVTVVAFGAVVPLAEQAAQAAAEKGIDVEVVDPRTLVPFDLSGVLESVSRTRRLVVADETHLSAGVAAEVVARVVESGAVTLKTPPVRVGTLDIPISASAPQEAYTIPSVERLAAAIEASVVG